MDMLLQDRSMKQTSIFNLTPPEKRLVIRNKFSRNQATMSYQEARIVFLIQRI
jgi:hypothetical protein